MLSVLFMSMLILEEVVIERCSRGGTFSGASSLGFGISVAEFSGCFLLAKFCGGQLLPEFGSWGRTLPTYMVLAFLVFCGSALPNYSVGLVQYPVKVVFKSSKLIPVMIVSVCLRNSRAYSRKEFLAAVLLCGGTAGFAIGAGRAGEPARMVYLGMGLLIVAVFADALLANFQQRMMQDSQVNPNSMMARVNFLGLAGLLICNSFSGEAARLVAHGRADSEVFFNMVLIMFTFSVGVWAYTHLINEAGAVFAVGVATLRKVVTVILSYSIFPKPFTSLHAVSACTLLAGMVLAQQEAQAQKAMPKPAVKKPSSASEECPEAAA